MSEYESSSIKLIEKMSFKVTPLGELEIKTRTGLPQRSTSLIDDIFGYDNIFTQSDYNYGSIIVGDVISVSSGGQSLSLISKKISSLEQVKEDTLKFHDYTHSQIKDLLTSVSNFKRNCIHDHIITRALFYNYKQETKEIIEMLVDNIKGKDDEIKKLNGKVEYLCEAIDNVSERLYEQSEKMDTLKENCQIEQGNLYGIIDNIKSENIDTHAHIFLEHEKMINTNLDSINIHTEIIESLIDGIEEEKTIIIDRLDGLEDRVDVTQNDIRHGIERIEIELVNEISKLEVDVENKIQNLEKMTSKMIIVD
jgi:hypothetical protein